MLNRMRFSRAFVLACFVFGVSLCLCGTRPPLGLTSAMAIESRTGESSSQIDDPRTVITPPRLREGSRIGSTAGLFSRVGRRWVFEVETVSPLAATDAAAPAIPVASSHQAPVIPTKYQVLENLALQRIVDAVSQDPNDLRWTVTGVITEFSGENWLLLSTVYRAPSKTTPDASK